MRLSSVLELARQYLLLGAIFAVFAAAAAVFGYFFVYKKTMKGEKRLSPAMMLWSAVFLCYLIVVFGGVMLSRGGIFGENSVELIPFSSYREAWITFDRGAWRNIILNIALFCTSGIFTASGHQMVPEILEDVSGGSVSHRDDRRGAADFPSWDF